MTVKECVLNILKNEPNLSNQEVADKVRKELNSKTTAANISWYKSKLSLNKFSKNDVSKSNLSQNGTNRGLEKFKDTFILANDPKNVMVILDTEARNTVQQGQLKRIKNRIKTCEFKGCHVNIKREIDTCHINQERNEILLNAIKKNKNGNKYDVYKILLQYRKGHEGTSYPENIRFLCRRHHKELDKNKTPRDKKLFVEKNLVKV